MQQIAAEVGYSETAFLAPDGVGVGRFRVRYFSPLAEVPFCGHATIAAGVALAGRGMATASRDLVLTTNDGMVPVHVVEGEAGVPVATLTSIAPWTRVVPDDLLTRALGLLGWQARELDASLPPAVAFAGARHLIIPVAALDTLQRMSYPFEPMKAFMLGSDLTTLHLVWRAGPRLFHARDAFAVGGVVEDPATGAAAAAFGGYLREHGEITAPDSFEIIQGVEMGRPSRLTVSIEPDLAGIRVSGSAVPI